MNAHLVLVMILRSLAIPSRRLKIKYTTPTELHRSTTVIHDRPSTLISDADDEFY